MKNKYVVWNQLDAEETGRLEKRLGSLNESLRPVRDRVGTEEPLFDPSELFDGAEEGTGTLSRERAGPSPSRGAADGSLRSVRARLVRGELSAEALVEEHLERAAAIAPLEAFITLMPDEAREAARRADRARARGDSLGPLHGIPVTAKDLVDSAGIRTTSGSKIFGDRVPGRDAPCLRALLDAGAILLGKTNLHELAYGVTNVNPHYGAVRNPWDRMRISGGSSGGSAVALACGVGYGSIGTDTGGSIRIPSALCGAAGLKPTYGRISRAGVTPLSWSLDHVGPMARTADDLLCLYEVLADQGDAPSSPPRLDTLRLGIHERLFFENVAPEVDSAVREAISRLEALGMTRVELDVPEVELQAACRNTIAFAEASSFHGRDIRNRPEDFGADTRELLRLGLLVPATDYLAAARVRRRIVRAFQQAFDDIDVLATPATVAAAPPIGAEVLDNGEELRAGLLRMASPFNTTGFPALSLPCGWTADGRPIGLQLVAKPYAEVLLLEVARAYERSASWYERRPVI